MDLHLTLNQIFLTVVQRTNLFIQLASRPPSAKDTVSYHRMQTLPILLFELCDIQHTVTHIILTEKAIAVDPLNGILSN